MLVRRASSNPYFILFPIVDIMAGLRGGAPSYAYIIIIYDSFMCCIDPQNIFPPSVRNVVNEDVLFPRG
jgi:hypothetical protein